MTKEADAIYQNGEVVGRVVDPEVDEAAKKIRFREIHHSEWLLLPEECDYGKYRILIQTVGDATREGAEAAQKGRILRALEADIVGYIEQ